MIVGSLVYSTNTGLGMLASEFYKNGIIDKVCIQKNPNKSLKNHHDRYPQKDILGKISCTKDTISEKDKRTVCEFIKKVDIIFLFETAFHNWIYKKILEAKKPLVLMPMYECTPKIYNKANVHIAVSDLDYVYCKKTVQSGKIVRLNVPSRDDIIFKQRNRAKTFVHNSGSGSYYDRNGTKVLLDSLKYIESPINLIIRFQYMDNRYCSYLELMEEDSRVKPVIGEVDFKDLWRDGDVFIFPERFNGLSLPIQEAFSSGMPIMCGNKIPFNRWLPKDLLINVFEYDKKRMSSETNPFNRAIYSSVEVARKIDEWYDKDISSFSLLGKKWAEENSWSVLREQYIGILNSL